jgi:arginyl-tRNA synthetase
MEDPSLAAVVARALHPALPEAAGLTVADVRDALAAPPDPALGDFAFPCFKLAKALKKGPPIIARELAEALRSPLFTATAAGPYLNLRLDLGQAAAHVLPPLARGDTHAPPPTGTRVMVEYSQPNTHKAFHVGHLRNLCLGDAIVRLLRADGDTVIAANYLGDVGAHIAKCLWWYLDHLSDRTPPASNRGEWLGELYATANTQLEVWDEPPSRRRLRRNIPHRGQAAHHRDPPQARVPRPRAHQDLVRDPPVVPRRVRRDLRVVRRHLRPPVLRERRRRTQPQTRRRVPPKRHLRRERGRRRRRQRNY